MSTIINDIIFKKCVSYDFEDLRNIEFKNRNNLVWFLIVTCLLWKCIMIFLIISMFNNSYNLYALDRNVSELCVRSFHSLRDDLKTWFQRLQQSIILTIGLRIRIKDSMRVSMVGFLFTILRWKKIKNPRSMCITWHFLRVPYVSYSAFPFNYVYDRRWQRART